MKQQHPLFINTGKKIAITIILAMVYWLVMHSSSCAQKPGFSSSDGPEASATYLQESYRTYNDQYFQNRLSSATITTDLGGDNMALTDCENDDGTGCKIQFNMHYSAAQRVALETELHEMCHIEVWSHDLAVNKPAFMSKLAYDHGKPWRACMERLYVAGAFHDLVIDNYDGRD